MKFNFLDVERVILLIHFLLEMMYLPISLRSKSGNYRFSIPGNPSLYLANSFYGCWIETGFPADIDFNVSPVLLDGKQKILNLVVGIRDFSELNELEDTYLAKATYVNDCNII